MGEAPLSIKTMGFAFYDRNMAKRRWGVNPEISPSPRIFFNLSPGVLFVARFSFVDIHNYFLINNSEIVKGQPYLD